MNRFLMIVFIGIAVVAFATGRDIQLDEGNGLEVFIQK